MTCPPPQYNVAKIIIAKWTYLKVNINNSYTVYKCDWHNVTSYLFFNNHVGLGVQRPLFLCHLCIIIVFIHILITLYFYIFCFLFNCSLKFWFCSVFVNCMFFIYVYILFIHFIIVFVLISFLTINYLNWREMRNVSLASSWNTKFSYFLNVLNFCFFTFI